MSKVHTISSYLIYKLYAHGIRHIFGVPGDYVLGFYKELEEQVEDQANLNSLEGYVLQRKISFF